MKLKHLLLSATATEGGSATNTTDIKPVGFSTPTKEDLSKDFNLDSSDVEILGGESATATAESAIKSIPTAPAPKAEKASAPKQETVQPKAEEKKSATQKEEVKPSLLKLAEKKTTARDYSGFTPEEEKILKSMSNEAFNHVAPILRAQKQAVVPTQPAPEKMFFQHPQGYILHPQYQQAQADIQYAQTEAQAWQEQLMKIKEGEEWTPLVGIDPKTGKFIYGEARKPTIQDEEMVRISMSKCMSAAQQAQQNLQQLPAQFQQIAQQDLTNINQERARRFDWVADPKLLDHQLEIEGVGPKKISDIRSDFIGLFPPYHHGTPGVEVAADLFVALQIYASRLKEAEAGKQVAETLKEEATRVEPTTTTRATKSGKAVGWGATEFSLDDMPT